MTQPLVNQPSALPTRKLTVAAMIAPAVTEAWGAFMTDVYPPVAGPEVSMLVGATAALLLGYFVRDRANV